jgi:hypothetical protein
MDPLGEEPDLTLVDEGLAEPMLVAQSGLATASKAVEMLAADHGYVAPTATTRRHVAMAFAAKNKVVYGKAFDAIRVRGEDPIDFDDFAAVEARIDDVVLCEVKSTRRDLDEEFAGYFFGLSTAELLVAQSLGANFEFALVNTASRVVRTLTLRELLARAKAIYPAWSLTI